MRRGSFSYDKYSGFDNSEINLLENELLNAEKLVKQIKKSIEEIYNNCEHEYKFVCGGTYEDAYKCCKCGHDEWK